MGNHSRGPYQSHSPNVQLEIFESEDFLSDENFGEMKIKSKEVDEEIFLSSDASGLSRSTEITSLMPTPNTIGAMMDVPIVSAPSENYDKSIHIFSRNAKIGGIGTQFTHVPWKVQILYDAGTMTSNSSDRQEISSLDSGKLEFSSEANPTSSFHAVASPILVSSAPRSAKSVNVMKEKTTDSSSRRIGEEKKENGLLLMVSVAAAAVTVASAGVYAWMSTH